MELLVLSSLHAYLGSRRWFWGANRRIDENQGVTGITDTGEPDTRFLEPVGCAGLPTVMKKYVDVMPELKPCRAPHCKYKAPVCEYGYCGGCCRKLHNYAVTGSLTKHIPPAWEPVQYGFKVIEHKSERSTVVTSPTKEDAPERPIEPPVLGTLENVVDMEYPVDDSVRHYTTI